MDDVRLARAVEQVTALEQEAQAYLAGLRPADLAERDQALVVYRQARALRKPLETWITVRALRALTTKG